MEAILKKINRMNPGKKIVSVFDVKFRRFGMAHKNYRIHTLMDYIKRNNTPGEDIVYIADVPEMRRELAGQLDPIINSIYAGMDVQVGVCYGKNNTLNALEHHQGSEVYIVGADMIMMLGSDEDIKWPGGTYDSSLIEFFYAPKGSVIELRGGCMHYAAINVFEQEGFSVIVSLLKDTNTEIDFKVGNQDRDKLLIAKNTWFLAHPEYSPARESGQHLGITGENLTIKTL
jgi:hypothetical protein